MKERVARGRFVLCLPCMLGCNRVCSEGAAVTLCAAACCRGRHGALDEELLVGIHQNAVANPRYQLVKQHLVALYL